jgi:hypothetical protein
MSCKGKSVCLVVLASMLAVAASASASVLTYTSESAFAAANTAAGSSLTTVDFEGLGTSGQYTYVASPYTTGGVSFANLSALVIANNAWGFTSVVMATDSEYATTITPPSGSTALGMDLLHLDTNSVSGTFNLSDGTTEAFSFPKGSTAAKNDVLFIGAMSSSATITSITIAAGAATGNDPFIGAVYYGTPATTPEPSTIVLAISGLFGLLAYAWRKRK